MAARSKSYRRWIAGAAGALLALILAGVVIWRDDIVRTSLDPKVPFQTYRPPAAPDYARPASWALLPDPSADGAERPADVFFVAPTTYDGGRHWNAPVGDPRAERYFRRSVEPNYAGPFERVGRVFAPRYRQASLYTLLTLREDAREARRFAYGDVLAAFRRYLERYNQGRPFVLVGVEQGGAMAARLLAEQVMADPQVSRRLAAAYLIETVVPAGAGRAPPCARREQAGCVAAWVTAVAGDEDRGQELIDRSLVWGQDGRLEDLNGRVAECFNPMLRTTSTKPAPARLNLGAANATGLEWGVRPAFLTRQVSARCENGVLVVSRPRSQLLRPAGSWADRRKVASYNLFWADLEADAAARVAVLRAESATPATAAGLDVSRRP